MTKQPNARAVAKKWGWFAFVAVALLWSCRLLYEKLLSEAAPSSQLSGISVNEGLRLIASGLSASLASIPASAWSMSALCAVVAYAALAWYDRIALVHLGREKDVPWPFVAASSFVTYALGHNLGASVLAGGLIRFRAYTSKGLTPGEIAILVTFCTGTFVLGTLILTGAVLVAEPAILEPIGRQMPALEIPPWAARAIGGAILLACGLYVVGSFLSLPPIHVRSLRIAYPNPQVVAMQLVAAPLEVAAAAGIISWALPEIGHPGYFAILGAFLVSFTAGLVSQTPGGIGVMEAVFLAMVDKIPASDVLAALLVWRLLYLLIPLALSIPAVVFFEKRRLASRPNGP